MFAKIAIVLSSLAVLATASPNYGTGSTTVSQCNTGSVQCCNNVGQFNDPSITSIASVIGVSLSSVDALVGLGCTSIDIVALKNGNCNQQAVCCQGNRQSGLVNVQCSPITV